MDSLTALIINTKTSNLKRKAPTSDETSPSSSKRACFYSTYRCQNFALPDSIIYFVTINPATTQGYHQLIKTCKYFFIKNPIIVHSSLFCDGDKCRENAKVEPPHRYSLKNFTSKLWVSDRLCVDPKLSKNQNIISSLIPKFYRFAAKELSLSNQSIFYNDYIFLCSFVEYIFFYNVIVNHKNDYVIVLEKLFENAVYVNSFTFLSDDTLTNITSKTSKKIFEITNFSKLKYFDLDHISDIFDIEAFYLCMKKNQSTIFNLKFDATISDAYKNRLETIIDEILSTENLDYKPPYIHFPGINDEKYRKLGLHLISLEKKMS